MKSLKIIMLVIVLFLCHNTLIAQDRFKQKELDGLSSLRYYKKFDSLNYIEKKTILQKYNKREHIYLLATKAGVQKTDVYKEHMKLIGKEQAMRLFLTNHRQNIKITKPQMKTYYEKHIRDYTSVHAYTIVRNNKKGKQNIQSYIKQLEQTPKSKQFVLFKELAKKYSLHPRRSKGGDLGFIRYGTMVQPFGKEAFRLKEGTFNHKPFWTTLGWHIVYIKERGITPFVKAKKNIEDILRSQKYKKWFNTL